MEEETTVETTQVPAGHAGAQLRAAREAAGFEIGHIAAETRIPQRHLVAIEAGEYSTLPSRTYAIGFARTYARFLGLDENAVVSQVRSDLAEGSGGAAQADRLEPGDPARVPSRGLAWFAVLAAIVLGAGIFAFYRTYFVPGLGPAPLTAPSTAPSVAAPRAAKPNAAPVAPVANGPVVFTSTMDGSWIKFYDGDGKRIYEGLMAKGESYTVPADAVNPQVRTGRPYAFDITVGGKPVAKLGEEDRVVSDVPVSAQALLTREAAAPPAASVPTPATRPAVPAPR